MKEAVYIMFGITWALLAIQFLCTKRMNEIQNEIDISQQNINGHLIKWVEEQERINKEMAICMRELAKENQILKKIILEQ